MKRALSITDPELISAMLKEGKYGVLALYGSDKNKPPAPYAVPVNYVYHDNAVYFHGSPKGKKMRLLQENPQVSFNVVIEDNIIPSYFVSNDNLACPATAFFKSITIDGTVEIIKDRDEIAIAFSSMMQSLQPEGKYIDFKDPAYDIEFKALVMVKINIQQLTAKFKFGQQVKDDVFQMILEHLEKRGTKLDHLTIKAMQSLREN